MIDHFRENLVAHWRETVGFALFLAWVYCALFGCGLSSAVEPIACVPTTYHLERIWLMCGLFEALGGVAGMLIARKVPAADRLLQSSRLLTAAAALAAAGNFFIWLAWSDRMLLFDEVFVAGSALSGIAIVLFSVDSAMMFYVGVFLFGIGFAALNIVPPMACRQAFGQKDYANIFSMVATGLNVFSGFSAIIYAQIFDITGSFAGCFWLIIGFYVVTLICSLVIVPMGRRSWAKK